MTHMAAGARAPQRRPGETGIEGERRGLYGVLVGGPEAELTTAILRLEQVGGGAWPLGLAGMGGLPVHPAPGRLPGCSKKGVAPGMFGLHRDYGARSAA